MRRFQIFVRFCLFNDFIRRSDQQMDLFSSKNFRIHPTHPPRRLQTPQAWSPQKTAAGATAQTAVLLRPVLLEGMESPLWSLQVLQARDSLPVVERPSLL